MTIEELVLHYQATAAENYAKVAAETLKRAELDTAAAQATLEKNELERKTADLMFRRIRTANRPAVVLGAAVSKESRESGDVFVATFSGLSVEGDSPEMAFSNFDRMWAGVEHDE